MVTNELQMVEFAYSIIGVHVPYRYTTYTAVNYILHITCTCVHGGMCVVPVPGTRVLWVVHRTVHHQRRGACYKGYLS